MMFSVNLVGIAVNSEDGYEPEQSPIFERLPRSQVIQFQVGACWAIMEEKTASTIE